jgi:hypothetical protein
MTAPTFRTFMQLWTAAKPRTRSQLWERNLVDGISKVLRRPRACSISSALCYRPLVPRESHGIMIAARTLSGIHSKLRITAPARNLEFLSQARSCFGTVGSAFSVVMVIMPRPSALI